jgi:hypothetical protein
MKRERGRRLTPEEVTELWRPHPDAIGPYMPPQIAWQRAGEPGWPFHYEGGPLPGTINAADVGRPGPQMTATEVEARWAALCKGIKDA